MHSFSIYSYLRLMYCFVRIFHLSKYGQKSYFCNAFLLSASILFLQLQPTQNVFSSTRFLSHRFGEYLGVVALEFDFWPETALRVMNRRLVLVQQPFPHNPGRFLLRSPLSVVNICR